MTTLGFVPNPLDPSTWEEVEVEGVADYLMSRLASWPSSGRIYDVSGLPSWRRAAPIIAPGVLEACDVTPHDEASVERLEELDGPLLVVLYPADPITAIIAIAAIAIGVAAAVFLMPRVPELANQQTQSPNNGLSERTNKPRPGERIPDIFGRVRSTPDLLALPYRVFEDHREVEISFMCIGRGAYDVSSVRDGDTLIENIQGASAAVYAPGTSPNNPLDVPQLQIGTAISDPVFNVSRLNEVNGQVLKAPNDSAVKAKQEILFRDGGIIEAAAGSGIDFTDFFQVDDVIDLGNATDPGTLVEIDAVMAAATAEAGGFVFATYDPTADFAAGQLISITGAIYTIDVTSDPTGGDLSGGAVVEDYPYDPWRNYGDNTNIP